MWLWHVKDHVTFDEGYRVKGFSRFIDEQQFEIEAKSLVESAAEEVQRYRGKFSNVSKVSNYYLQNRPNEPKQPINFWKRINAGISCGLSGKPDQARGFFQEILDMKELSTDWLKSGQADALKLYSLADNTSNFREIILNRINKTRENFGLPYLTTIDFG